MLRIRSVSRGRIFGGAVHDLGSSHHARGAEVVLPEHQAGPQGLVPVGDWILYDDAAFVGILHDSFTTLYEELG
jgi:hypothetical protein